MVGRFVEQQQVRRQQQQPAQRHPAALAAGQRLHVSVGRRQTQRVHREVQTRVQVPRIGGVNPILQFRLLFKDLVHLLGRHLVAEFRVDGIVAVEHGFDLGDAFFDVAAHILIGVERRFLLQEANADALSGKRFADEIGFGAGHDLEQRGLAGAVQAKHADLCAGQE